MNTNTIHFDHDSEAREIGAALGPLQAAMERDVDLQLIIRDCTIRVDGADEPSRKITQFIEGLCLARTHRALNTYFTRYAYEAFCDGEEQIFERLASIQVKVSSRKPAIFPKTLGQQIYLDVIHHHAITFGIGPAGTGKTYLARWPFPPYCKAT